MSGGTTPHTKGVTTMSEQHTTSDGYSTICSWSGQDTITRTFGGVTHCGDCGDVVTAATTTVLHTTAQGSHVFTWTAASTGAITTGTFQDLAELLADDHFVGLHTNDRRHVLTDAGSLAEVQTTVTVDQEDVVTVTATLDGVEIDRVTYDPSNA